MSGIEIIGLALGSLPVAVQTFEGYMNISRTFKQWRKLRPAFVILDGDLERQQSRLKQNAHKILLSLDLDDHKIERMIIDPTDEAWKEQDFQQQIQRYFKTDYQSYVKTMKGLNQAIQDLECALHMDPSKKQQILGDETKASSQATKSSHLLGSIDFSLELQKLRISSRIKKLKENVSEIKLRLDELESLLRNDEDIRRHRKLREAQSSTKLKTLRQHVKILHALLSTQFPCSCIPKHDNATVLLKHKAIHPQFQDQLDIYHNAEASADSLQVAMMALDSCKITSQRSYGPFDCFISLENSPNQDGGLEQAERVEQLATSCTTRVETFATAASKSSKCRQEQLSRTLCSCLDDSKTLKRHVQPHFEEGFLATLDHRPIIDRGTIAETRYAALHDLLPLHSRTEFSAPQVRWKSLSLQRRVHMALEVASSFFYLIGTPWSNELGWDSEDIRLLEVETTSGTYCSAAIEQNFPQPDKLLMYSFLDVSRALLQLGICLEELCFGDILARQDFYQDYFGPNSRPHRFTEYAAAKEWAERLKTYVGNDYYEAVSICLGQSQLVDNRILSEDKLRGWQAIHDAVVEPLRRVLKELAVVDQFI